MFPLALTDKKMPGQPWKRLPRYLFTYFVLYSFRPMSTWRPEWASDFFPRLSGCTPPAAELRHKLSVLLYFSILGERPLNIGAIQESCTCESQKSVIRRKVTPNLHTCAAEAQKEREPVSRFPLKKCLFIRLWISRSNASAGRRKPCRGGPRREPSREQCRGWRPGCTA